jgi:hypothetical protein
MHDEDDDRIEGDYDFPYRAAHPKREAIAMAVFVLIVGAIIWFLGAWIWGLFEWTL